MYRVQLTCIEGFSAEYERCRFGDGNSLELTNMSCRRRGPLSVYSSYIPSIKEWATESGLLGPTMLLQRCRTLRISLTSVVGFSYGPRAVTTRNYVDIDLIPAYCSDG